MRLPQLALAFELKQLWGITVMMPWPLLLSTAVSGLRPLANEAATCMGAVGAAVWQWAAL
jgi:hypothetical protein